MKTIPTDEEGQVHLREDVPDLTRVGDAWDEAWAIRAAEVRARLTAPVSDEADDLVIALEVGPRLARLGDSLSIEESLRAHGRDPSSFE